MFETSDAGSAPCSMGLDQKVAVLLSYLLGWIGGLVFYFGERENRFVRFSAMQSLMINAGWIGIFFVMTVLSRIPLLGIVFWIVNMLVTVGVVAVIVLLAVQGFKGAKVKLPIIGGLAEQWSSDDS